jgi:hypothetical protein
MPSRSKGSSDWLTSAMWSTPLSVVGSSAQPNEHWCHCGPHWLASTGFALPVQKLVVGLEMCCGRLPQIFVCLTSFVLFEVFVVVKTHLVVFWVINVLVAIWNPFLSGMCNHFPEDHSIYFLLNTTMSHYIHFKLETSVNIVMNLRVPYSARNYLTSWMTV